MSTSERGAVALAAALAMPLTMSLACGRPEPPPAPAAPAPPPAPSAPAASAIDADAEPAITEDTPWPALVRGERWDAAWRVLDALPEPERAKPEVRYVRARVALERGDASAALPLLDGLESVLPLLADDVARRRAEAKLAVGPYAEAGEWFALKASPGPQLDAARAFEKAHDTKRARAAADRVLASERRTRDQEGEARALRVRVDDPLGDLERADARWLAVQGADLAAASDALNLVARVDPRHPLTADELLARAKVLSDAMRPDDALRAIDLVPEAPGGDKVSKLAREHARGMTLFHARGRWTEAAKVLSECAVAAGPRGAEDAFYAARALSRADRDDEAVRGYEDVEKRFARTPWSDQAAFYAPYLQMLHGEWAACARGFEAYVRAYPAGRESHDAGRDGTLCKLLDGETKAARAGFEQLVEDEPDPVLSARMADMAALAALRDGDRTHAIARWTDVARSRPLSWPALVARARLALVKAPMPPVIDPADVPQGADPPPLAVLVPPPADTLHRLGLEVDAEQALHEREGAVTLGAGARAPEALCRAYGEIGRARRRYQIAQTLPSALFNAEPGPRTRWAWECAYPSPYAEEVRAAEGAEKLPPGLLWAVMRQESAYDPDAVSAAHAVGLMQLMPDTARPVAEELGLPRDDARLTSPPYAIRVGARLLRRLLDQFHGNVPLAVAAYNGGAEAIDRWMSRAPGMQLDTFVERIPFKETREYVARVMGNFARYAYLLSGEGGVPTVDLELRR
ncbi:MAG TPA: lytic transglycosylase domain-containing protein [Polyangiaceae bacterium]|jgi:soluble lytic murein transglycosylase|nr:lytic transglycosylase domain-containing protein [Polyangiaceae bacterium]